MNIFWKLEPTGDIRGKSSRAKVVSPTSSAKFWSFVVVEILQLAKNERLNHRNQHLIYINFHEFSTLIRNMEIISFCWICTFLWKFCENWPAVKHVSLLEFGRLQSSRLLLQHDPITPCCICTAVNSYVNKIKIQRIKFH